MLTAQRVIDLIEIPGIDERKTHHRRTEPIPVLAPGQRRDPRRNLHHRRKCGGGIPPEFQFRQFGVELELAERLAHPRHHITERAEGLVEGRVVDGKRLRVFDDGLDGASHQRREVERLDLVRREYAEMIEIGERGEERRLAPRRIRYVQCGGRRLLDLGARRRLHSAHRAGTGAGRRHPPQG